METRRQLRFWPKVILLLFLSSSLLFTCLAHSSLSTTEKATRSRRVSPSNVWKALKRNDFFTLSDSTHPWASTDGVFEPTIIGGERVSKCIPWMVSFRLASLDHKFISKTACGGSLVSSQHVLTARHCLEPFDGDMEFAEPIKDVPGPLYLHAAIGGLNERNMTQFQLLRVFNKTSPPLVVKDGMSPDLCLVSLEKVIDNHTIRMSRGRKGEEEPGRMARVYGWGVVNDTTRESSRYLLQTDVPIIDNGLCGEMYGNSSSITNNELCAGDVLVGGCDACQGDSGHACQRHAQCLPYRPGQWSTWGCGVSEFPWTYTDTETALILEGEVTVTPDDASLPAVTFGAGAYVEFPAGMSCTWKVTKPIKKHYMFS